MSSTRLLCVSSNPRRTVGGRYELVRVLGRGSMGEVWLAEHTTLRRPVAIKVLTHGPWGGSLEEASTAAARFRFEAQVAARLSCKTRHIVQVTDHGEDNGVPYLVMERLDGLTLETHLVHQKRMTPQNVSALVNQISRALQEAHAEGVVHRDLKPSNVFLTTDEDARLLVKLFDFGIACMTRPRRVVTGFATVAGFMLGTPGYMSPEQARGASDLDHYCDLWALATIAYEALTGDLPLEGCDTDDLLKNVCAGRIVPLRDRAPDLPAGLGCFFEKAFAERTQDRFSSAEEFAKAFEQATIPVEAIETLAPPKPANAPSHRSDVPASGMRRRVRRPLMGVAALALLGLSTVGSARAVRETPLLAAMTPTETRGAMAPRSQTASPTGTIPAAPPVPVPPTEPTPDTPEPPAEGAVVREQPAGTAAATAAALVPATAPARMPPAPAPARRTLDRSDTL